MIDLRDKEKSGATYAAPPSFGQGRTLESFPKDDFVVTCSPEVPNSGLFGVTVLAIKRAGLSKFIRAGRIGDQHPVASVREEFLQRGDQSAACATTLLFGKHCDREHVPCTVGKGFGCRKTKANSVSILYGGQPYAPVFIT